MTSESTYELHFLLIPFLAPGHTIPMIDMAKLLAQQPDVTVTVVTTPVNAARYGAVLNKIGPPVGFLQLPFPATEVGLPEGCESLDALPTPDLALKFLTAVDMLQSKLDQTFHTLDPPPSCIISDKYLAWTADTAAKHQIPRITFDGMSCFKQLCAHSLYASKVFDKLPESETFVVPGLPDRIELTRSQLPVEFNPSSQTSSDRLELVRKTDLESYGMVINSFEELEQEYVNEYKKLKSGKIWCIGPLSLYNDSNKNKAQREKNTSVLKWLNSHPHGSVIYACLGSVTRVTPLQLIELGLGLEASNHPFIWVIRNKEVEKWVVESGFEDRIKDKGLGFLIRGWAPQVLILSHPSVGGFLTHCGWNSILEGVCGGVPMVTWPQFADQFLNEKLVVEVLGVGVGVGAKGVVHWGEEEKFGVNVKSEDVKKAILKVMDLGIEGVERREKVKGFGEVANRVIEEGGKRNPLYGMQSCKCTLLHLHSNQPNCKMASEESHEHNQLHFLIIPLASPGHYIPTIDIANLLAQHGVKVTIVTTPVNALRFGSILDQPIKSGLPIHFLEFPFPSMEFGLPEGCESLDTLPTFDLLRPLFLAYNTLQEKVERYIETLNPKPSCIISDTFLLWPAETAKKFQIPRIIFDGMNCFTQMCNHVLQLTKVHETVSKSESFVLPGLPDRIELTRSQLPFVFNPKSKHADDFHEKLRVSESEVYGVIINSFQELENGYADEYRKLKRGKVWCIGPLSLCYKDASEKAIRGNKSSINKNECIKWLDSQKNSSVIYACLGSVSRVEPNQLIELALGLEASRKPFIWVVRAGHKTQTIEKWIDEEGFEERTKERGLLIRGWAPQLVILSHPAIGGFLTHCGWNSTLEGVCGGVPMVTWPQFQEQFLNEKLIVQVLRIGVSVGAQNAVNLGEEEKSGVGVKREDLRKAVEMVMEDGEEGEERRKRAKELSKMANEAIEEGGSSYRNITQLMEDIRHQA
ncbi:hypothetical protein LXL04_005086 [Taraxacum kok-saghyz]